ncbi:hypothetical protein C7475_108219 [Chitinophaga sp. S165]|nr:hypothetical protein C7475_108219 [Chitinophaga sp. S165]
MESTGAFLNFVTERLLKNVYQNDEKGCFSGDS